MVKTELVYNFDDYYGKGRDAFRVVVNNFKYYIEATEDDLELSHEELLEKYYDEAFTTAAICYMDDVASILSAEYKAKYSA